VHCPISRPHCHRARAPDGRADQGRGMDRRVRVLKPAGHRRGANCTGAILPGKGRPLILLLRPFVQRLPPSCQTPLVSFRKCWDNPMNPPFAVLPVGVATRWVVKLRAGQESAPKTAPEPQKKSSETPGHAAAPWPTSPVAEPGRGRTFASAGPAGVLAAVRRILESSRPELETQPLHPFFPCPNP